MIIYPERVQDLDLITEARLMRCMKKPLPVSAVQMKEDFRVDSMEGDYKQGKAGDYLMCGIKGELYICDKDIFEESYNFI